MLRLALIQTKQARHVREDGITVYPRLVNRSSSAIVNPLEKSAGKMVLKVLQGLAGIKMANN